MDKPSVYIIASANEWEAMKESAVFSRLFVLPPLGKVQIEHYPALLVLQPHSIGLDHWVPIVIPLRDLTTEAGGWIGKIGVVADRATVGG